MTFALSDISVSRVNYPFRRQPGLYPFLHHGDRAVQLLCNNNGDEGPQTVCGLQVSSSAISSVVAILYDLTPHLVVRAAFYCVSLSILISLKNQRRCSTRSQRNVKSGIGKWLTRPFARSRQNCSTKTSERIQMKRHRRKKSIVGSTFGLLR